MGIGPLQKIGAKLTVDAHIFQQDIIIAVFSRNRNDPAAFYASRPKIGDWNLLKRQVVDL